MRRLLFALLASAACLHATSFAFTSCTAGTEVLSPCNSDFSLTFGGITGPDYFVRAFAQAPVTLNTSEFQGSDVSTLTAAAAQAPASLPVQATAQAGDSVTYYTSGPARPGFIQFSIELDYLHEDFYGASEILLSDGVHQYSFIGGGGINGPIPPTHCFIEDCEYAGTLPFDLGAPFEASASSHSGSSGGPGGANAAAVATFTLLEANGTTPVPHFVTPEPSAWQLLMIGLATCGALRRSARNRARSAAE